MVRSLIGKTLVCGTNNTGSNPVEPYWQCSSVVER